MSTSGVPFSSVPEQPDPNIDKDCGRYMKVAADLLKRGDFETGKFFQDMGAVCQTYKAGEGDYSPEGQRALQKIRPQLAQGLERDLQENSGKTGKDLKQAWLRNHPQVYKEAGVCDLPAKDKMKIVSTASPLLRENPGMAVQAVAGGAGSVFKETLGKDPLSPAYRASSTENK